MEFLVLHTVLFQNRIPRVQQAVVVAQVAAKLVVDQVAAKLVVGTAKEVETVELNMVMIVHPKGLRKGLRQEHNINQ